MKNFLLLVAALAIIFTITACVSEGDQSAKMNDRQNIDQSTGQDIEQDTEPSVEQNTQQETIETEFTVWGMTCNRCVNTISKAVMALDGVTNVTVDLDNEKVTVEHVPTMDVELIKSSITAKGYNTPD